uniref:Uncharacterized protein n=1 Tax=Arundo donax TaxID=35708 RepID=A0A0A9B1D9_ARUDO
MAGSSLHQKHCPLINNDTTQHKK